MGNRVSRQAADLDSNRVHGSPLTSPADLSIIIPALDEERNVCTAIRSTRVPNSQTQPEVVVVDGGSKDNTVQAAQVCCSCIITAVRGRGAQLNAGAAAARGQWLLFLHADSTLPEGYFGALTAAVRPRTPPSGWYWLTGNQARPCWGCFQSIETGVSKLRPVQLGVWLRTRLFGRPYGDQALFCHRSCFQDFKFSEWPFLEDLDWVIRVKSVLGRPAIVPLPVHTSPRRWQHYGVARTTLINQIVLAGFALGVPIETLHQYYTSARDVYVKRDSRKR